jgi:hypothetical protein
VGRAAARPQSVAARKSCFASADTNHCHHVLLPAPPQEAAGKSSSYLAEAVERVVGHNFTGEESLRGQRPV